MRTYIWYTDLGYDGLTDVAIAVADSEEQAREFVRERWLADRPHFPRTIMHTLFANPPEAVLDGLGVVVLP